MILIISSAGIILTEVWNNKKIPISYRQNIICYINKENNYLQNKSILDSFYPHNIMLSVVHPELYSIKVRKMVEYKRKLDMMNPKKIIRWIIKK